MKMLTGYLLPTEGEIHIGGHDVTKDPVAAKKLIGYLPESAPVYPDMTVYEFLKFSAEIRGMRGSSAREAVDRMIATCFLEDVVHQSIDTLSKGYRHRTCLAQSVIHDPEVVIMDEPTDGLDPNQKHEIRSLIQKMGQDKAVIFSTHILEEVEAVCSRILLINHGKQVAEGTPRELKNLAPHAGAYLIELDEDDPKELKKFLQNQGLTEDMEHLPNSSFLLIKPASKEQKDSLNKKIPALMASSPFSFRQIREEEGDLLDSFRSLTIGQTTQPEETNAK